MQDQWTDKLSDYVDGELAPRELDSLESHLGSCEACRVVVEELRGVVRRAEDLSDELPATDLWPGVAARIAVGAESDVVSVTPLRPPRRRFEFSMPQLAAAAVALVVLSGGVTAAFNSGAGGVPAVVTAPGNDGTLIPAAAASAEYDMAIAEMEHALEQGRDHLDPETVRVLRDNLAAIDAAILEARGALAVDPGSAYLNSYLAKTMRRKLDILERGNNLIAAAAL